MSVYQHMDVVWCKCGGLFWPGEVRSTDSLPKEIREGFLKTPLVVVKFFDEEGYEFVLNEKNIFPYNCERKQEFILKGLARTRTKAKEGATGGWFAKFPRDVVHCEKITKGNKNILNEEPYAEKKEKKVDYSLIFGDPEEIELKKSSSSSTSKKGKQRGPPEIPIQKPPDSPTKTITHPRFVGGSDHCVRILTQPSTPFHIDTKAKDGSIQPVAPKYSCHLCDFVASRINVIVLHNKSHSAPSRTNLANYERPKEKKVNAKVSSKRFSEQKFPVSSKKRDRAISPEAESAKRPRLTRKEKENKKEMSKVKEEKKNAIFGDWSEDENEEEEEKEKLKESIENVESSQSDSELEDKECDFPNLDDHHSADSDEDFTVFKVTPSVSVKPAESPSLAASKPLRKRKAVLEHFEREQEQFRKKSLVKNKSEGKRTESAADVISSLIKSKLQPNKTYNASSGKPKLSLDTEVVHVVRKNKSEEEILKPGETQLKLSDTTFDINQVLSDTVLSKLPSLPDYKKDTKDFSTEVPKKKSPTDVFDSNFSSSDSGGPDETITPPSSPTPSKKPGIIHKSTHSSIQLPTRPNGQSQLIRHESPGGSKYAAISAKAKAKQIARSHMAREEALALKQKALVESQKDNKTPVKEKTFNESLVMKAAENTDNAGSTENRTPSIPAPDGEIKSDLSIEEDNNLLSVNNDQDIQLLNLPEKCEQKDDPKKGGVTVKPCSSLIKELGSSEPKPILESTTISSVIEPERKSDKNLVKATGEIFDKECFNLGSVEGVFPNHAKGDKKKTENTEKKEVSVNTPSCKNGELIEEVDINMLSNSNGGTRGKLLLKEIMKSSVTIQKDSDSDSLIKETTDISKKESGIDESFLKKDSPGKKILEANINVLKEKGVEQPVQKIGNLKESREMLITSTTNDENFHKAKITKTAVTEFLTIKNSTLVGKPDIHDSPLVISTVTSLRSPSKSLLNITPISATQPSKQGLSVEPVIVNKKSTISPVKIQNIGVKSEIITKKDHEVLLLKQRLGLSPINTVSSSIISPKPLVNVVSQTHIKTVEDPQKQVIRPLSSKPTLITVGRNLGETLKQPQSVSGIISKPHIVSSANISLSGASKKITPIPEMKHIVAGVSKPTFSPIIKPLVTGVSKPVLSSISKSGVSVATKPIILGSNKPGNITISKPILSPLKSGNKFVTLSPKKDAMPKSQINFTSCVLPPKSVSSPILNRPINIESLPGLTLDHKKTSPLTVERLPKPIVKTVELPKRNVDEPKPGSQFTRAFPQLAKKAEEKKTPLVAALDRVSTGTLAGSLDINTSPKKTQQAVPANNDDGNILSSSIVDIPVGGSQTIDAGQLQFLTGSDGGDSDGELIYLLVDDGTDPNLENQTLYIDPSQLAAARGVARGGMILENNPGSEPMLIQGSGEVGGHVLLQASGARATGSVLLQATQDSEPVLFQAADGQVVLQDNPALSNVVFVEEKDGSSSNLLGLVTSADTTGGVATLPAHPSSSLLAQVPLITTPSQQGPIMVSSTKADEEL